MGKGGDGTDPPTLPKLSVFPVGSTTKNRKKNISSGGIYVHIFTNFLSFSPWDLVLTTRNCVKALKRAQLAETLQLETVIDQAGANLSVGVLAFPNL